MTAAETLPAPSEGEPLVRFRDVVRRFGAVTAVDGVSLDIAAGEFFTLLGPSGCGKTTLMRLLAGFEHPDRGDVLLAGESVLGVPPHRRPVNMMFQSYALFPHLDVAENVGFGLREAGVARGERDRRVAEALALVRLDGLGGRRPSQLSGGQKQRVALARALVLRPRVLLLDEPLGALDKTLRQETQRELKRLQRETGTTFIVVTHDQDEAMALSDRIAVMRLGRIEQAGSPADLYGRPANAFVAGFVGEANMFASEIIGRDADRIRVAHPAAADGLLVPAAAEGEGRRGFFALRPERLAIEADSGDTPRANALSGRLIDLSYRGALTVCRVDAGGPAPLVVTRPNGHGVQPLPPAGASVTLRFAPDDAMPLPGGIVP